MAPVNVAGSMYQTSSYQGGYSRGNYSLDEYSQHSDGDSNSAGYSESSSFERSHHTRDPHDYQTGGGRMHHQHSGYGSRRGNLQYISESYGDDSGME
jgi:hypothetical protein